MSVRLLKCRYTCVIDRSWPGERARHLSVALSRIWEVSGARVGCTRRQRQRERSSTTTAARQRHSSPRNTFFKTRIFSVRSFPDSDTHCLHHVNLRTATLCQTETADQSIDSPPTAYTEHSGRAAGVRPAVVDTAARLQTRVTRLTAQQLGCHSD